MCWEHEDEYDEVCFDFLWNDCGIFENESIVCNMNSFQIEFINHKAEMMCRTDFFNLLTKWHNEGLISPKNERRM